MPTLTPAQIAVHARAAGFRDGAGYRGRGLTWAVAVALAESGGDPAAVGDRALVTAKWGPSIGLWQIRSLNAERGTGGTRDASRLTDPAYNARSAYAISSGGRDFGPWTVLGSGAAATQLGRAAMGVAQAARGDGGGATPATPALDPFPWDGLNPGPDLWDLFDGDDDGLLSAPGGGDGLSSLGGITAALGVLAQAVRRVAAWTSNPHNWARVAMVAAGGVLLALAVSSVLRQQGQAIAGQLVAARTGGAAPAAAAA